MKSISGPPLIGGDGLTLEALLRQIAGVRLGCFAVQLRAAVEAATQRQRRYRFHVPRAPMHA